MLRLLLLMFGLGLFTSTSSANTSLINSEDNRAGLVSVDEVKSASYTYSKKELKKAWKKERKEQRLQKRMEWLSRIVQKKMAKKMEKQKRKNIGGIDDPVDKWFWYWAIAWGAGILFLIVSVNILATIAFILGTVAAVIWVVNRFG